MLGALLSLSLVEFEYPLSTEVEAGEPFLTFRLDAAFQHYPVVDDLPVNNDAIDVPHDFGNDS